MSLQYTSVQWNRQKRLYDFAIVGGVALFLVGFALVTAALFPFITAEILIIRDFGVAAFLLLHIVLCIGPLCRLDPRFLPLLYNRRHLGVTLFLLALVHAFMIVATYHGGGDVNPFLSIFVSGSPTASLAGMPFQTFGFFAFVILFLMAATSHDFWLANLSPRIWKSLHMLVYFAYALLVLHVTFGVLQSEHHPLYVAVMALGLFTVLVLHCAAACREARIDHSPLKPCADGFVDACAISDIPENRARTVCIAGERVAIFRYNGKISAVSNVCQHQHGPLGEGKIISGCLTCPWHGYQYLPETGASPPPFVEKISTFNLQIRAGRIWVHPRPNPPGTAAKPALIES